MKEQLKQLEADLWSTANNLRANSDLKSGECSTLVLGPIFLEFADNRYRCHSTHDCNRHPRQTARVSSFSARRARRVYFEQMKGARHPRAFAHRSPGRQRLRPPASRPFVRRCCRRLESDRTDSRPLEKKPTVALDALLLGVTPRQTR